MSVLLLTFLWRSGRNRKDATCTGADPHSPSSSALDTGELRFGQSRSSVRL